MDELNGIHIGDLRALALMYQGVPLCSIGYIMKTSNPQIRRRLIRLERIYGVDLFEKVYYSKGKRVKLTEEGQRIGELAVRVVELAEITKSMP